MPTKTNKEKTSAAKPAAKAKEKASVAKSMAKVEEKKSSAAPVAAVKKAAAKPVAAQTQSGQEAATHKYAAWDKLISEEDFAAFLKTLPESTQ